MKKVTAFFTAVLFSLTLGFSMASAEEGKGESKGEGNLWEQKETTPLLSKDKSKNNKKEKKKKKTPKKQKAKKKKEK